MKGLKTKKVTATEATVIATVATEQKEEKSEVSVVYIEEDEEKDKYQYEEEDGLVSTYATDKDRVSESKFARDTENYSEIEMFTNTMIQFYNTFEAKFKPENYPDLTNFIRKYPHPRFLNPSLCFIVVNYFKNRDIYEYKNEYAARYNAEVQENIYKKNVLQLINTDKDINKSYIQPHDIFRYILLFNKYK
jgi:hypothetical protein